MLGRKYDRSFYVQQRNESREAAAEIVPLILRWTGASSVVDVGCGIGTWLSVFHQLGVTDILGIDGSHVDPKMLEIPVTHFRDFELNQAPLDLGRRFDLALSLEVAEHLETETAARFVRWLTTLSDVVLFSAAMPYQGGTGHVNENWLEYWAALFEDERYVPVDRLRPEIWDNERVVWWYRQNTVFFVREDALPRVLPDWNREAGRMPLSLVHPEFLLWAEFRRKWFARGFQGEVDRYRRAVRSYRGRRQRQ